jgi:hypothetical protein
MCYRAVVSKIPEPACELNCLDACNKHSVVMSCRLRFRCGNGMIFPRCSGGIQMSITLMILFAAGSIAQEINTDYERHADFSHYKKFSFEKVETILSESLKSPCGSGSVSNRSDQI